MRSTGSAQQAHTERDPELSPGHSHVPMAPAVPLEAVQNLRGLTWGAWAQERPQQPQKLLQGGDQAPPSSQDRQGVTDGRGDTERLSPVSPCLWGACATQAAQTQHLPPSSPTAALPLQPVLCPCQNPELFLLLIFSSSGNPPAAPQAWRWRAWRKPGPGEPLWGTRTPWSETAPWPQAHRQPQGPELHQGMLTPIRAEAL